MKEKLIITAIAFLWSTIFFSSCDTSSAEGQQPKQKLSVEYYKNGAVKSEVEGKDGKAHGLMKNYSPRGTLESVYTFKMGFKDGPAVIYYPNGVLREKIMYKDGYRHGISQMFYRSGELYRESPYSSGKLEGIRVSYYKDGSLMAKAPYKDGYPGLGLEEFNPSGEIIHNQPEIIIEPINNLALDNKYILNLRLSPPKAGTVFYIGDLTEGKYLHRGLYPIDAVEGTGKYTLRVNKGDFRMETISISAQYQTNKSNYGLVSRSYNLAIDNK